MLYDASDVSRSAIRTQDDEGRNRFPVYRVYGIYVPGTIHCTCVQLARKLWILLGLVLRAITMRLVNIISSTHPLRRARFSSAGESLRRQCYVYIYITSIFRTDFRNRNITLSFSRTFVFCFSSNRASNSGFNALFRTCTASHVPIAISYILRSARVFRTLYFQVNEILCLPTPAPPVPDKANRSTSHVIEL